MPDGHWSCLTDQRPAPEHAPPNRSQGPRLGGNDTDPSKVNVDGDDPDEEVELGTWIEARTRGAPHLAVFAIRVARDLLTRMTEYGDERSMTVSEVILQGAERLVGVQSDEPTNVSK